MFLAQAARDSTWSANSYTQDSKNAYGISTGFHRSYEICRDDKSAIFHTSQHTKIINNRKPSIQTKASAIQKRRFRKSPAKATHHVRNHANSKVLRCVFDTPDEPCVFLPRSGVKVLSLVR